jgi:hypothetical protein
MILPKSTTEQPSLLESGSSGQPNHTGKYAQFFVFGMERGGIGREWGRELFPPYYFLMSTVHDGENHWIDLRFDIWSISLVDKDRSVKLPNSVEEQHRGMTAVKKCCQGPGY